jgi:putative membrane protein
MPSEHRLHPYSVIFGFLSQIRAFVVPGILVLVGASTRGGDWEPWMMLFIIPSIGLAFVRYLTYRYEYDANELVVREGLLFRKERHIPYARIQNIDAVQKVLHRVLGVVEVRVHTGAGAAPDATMSVLPMAALVEMRRRVFADRNAGAVASADTARALPPPLLALGVRDLLLCGFIENRGAVLIAAGFGFLWEVGVMDRVLGTALGERTSGRGMIRDLIRNGIGSDVVSIERVAVGLLALAGLLLAIRGLSMMWAVVRLYGFAIRLDREDLRSEYGLLTRVAATVPLHRIQALTVRETPLHRLFGRVSVSADTAGGGSGTEGSGRRERELLAPLLRREALGDFVGRVLDGIDIDSVRWQPVSPRAFRREIKGWLFTAAVLLAAALAVAGWWGLVLTPLLVSWAWVGARQTIRHLGWARTDESIFFRNGWLWRRMSVARVAKIQAVTLSASPFDRRTAMARVRVDTAGASTTDRIDVPYLPADEAGRLHAALAQAAGETAFRW